jgi:hypothetical protein
MLGHVDLSLIFRPVSLLILDPSSVFIFGRISSSWICSSILSHHCPFALQYSMPVDFESCCLARKPTPTNIQRECVTATIQKKTYQSKVKRSNPKENGPIQRKTIQSEENEPVQSRTIQSKGKRAYPE